MLLDSVGGDVEAARTVALALEAKDSASHKTNDPPARDFTLLGSCGIHK
jgi:hypothetical protein